MLETYGLHQLIWNTADERFPDVLVASAADAEGRGIKLLVMDNGSFVDLSDARCYLIWRHRRTGVRGTEEFDNADADEGRFTVPVCPHIAAG